MISFHKLKVPLPFALKYVNSYIFEEEQGLTVVDPGIHTEETIEAWENWLSEHEFTWKQIRRIILTHHHPDHYGFSGMMQLRSGGAPVWMARKGHLQTQRLWVGERDMGRSQMKGFIQHGLPEPFWKPMQDHMDTYIGQVSPHPEVRYIEPGETIRIGNGDWTVLEMSGHAYGQLCFYESTTKQCLIGDHVLPQITPNVAYLPEVDENPLATFITALREMQKIDVSVAYPGHRDPIENVSERIDTIIAHHEERLDRMLSVLKGVDHASGMTAFDCCLAIFGDKLGVHQLRFALSETIAHLVYLEQKGALLQRVRGDGLVVFELNRSLPCDN
jgi:glyoxylase-like metal-dependent hydrolase (beta-lactamase superfamily II)